MKKSDLKQIIKEEISKVLKEGDSKRVKAFLFGMFQSALAKNKVMELQKELEDNNIELFLLDYDLAKTNRNAFLKDAQALINRADWDAVSMGDLVGIQKTLKL